MGRMLDALKRIEVKSHSPRLPDEPAPSADAPGRTGPAEPAAAAVEAALRQLETAFTLEAEIDSGPPIEQSLAPAEQSPAPAEQSPAPAEPCGDPYGDPYGELADNVLGQLTPGRPAALVFTSPSDGSGKTVVLARLAPQLAARAEGEVLLVDANFRSPDLAAEFGVEIGRALPDVLCGAASWAGVVRPTNVPRLSLLPGGRLDLDGPQAEGQPDLGRLMRELTQHYALVLVDAASLAHAEAAPLTACCEGTYLVVRLGRTNRRLVRAAAAVIEQCRGRLLGCIAVTERGV